jgi:hypothetical protein
MKRAPALELTRTFCFVRRSTRNAQVAGLKVLWLKGSLVRMPLMRQTLSPVTSPPLKPHEVCNSLFRNNQFINITTKEL